MLYKLLEANPSWLFTATAHGWVHPVIKSIEIHENETTNTHLEIDLSADYRIRLTPKSASGQILSLLWETPPPAVVAGRRLTQLEFSAIDQIPRLDMVVGRHAALIVQGVDASLALPVTWEVLESHDGLWNSWYSRVFGVYQHVDTVSLMTH